MEKILCASSNHRRTMIVGRFLRSLPRV